MARTGEWRAGRLAAEGFRALERGDAATAEASFRRSLAEEGRAAPVLQGLGLALASQKRLPEARRAQEQALAQMGGDAGLLANLGATCAAMADHAAAERYCRRAVKLAPGLAPAWNTLGLALLRQGRPDEAEAVLRRGLGLSPHFAQCRANWREAFAAMIERHRDTEPTEALLGRYQAAMEVDPGWTEMRYERSLVMLARGDLAGGWPDYAVRYDDLMRFPMPAWDGRPLAPGQVLLVRSEQGIGEQTMFASTLPDLLRRVERPIVEIDARLVPLFARSFPDAEFVGWFDPPDRRLARRRLDRQVALGRLPSIFRPDFAAFGDRAPYLVADAGRVAGYRAAWRRDGRPVVGISWASGRSPVAGRKTVPLDCWAPVFARPDLRFVSLQYDPAEDDLARIRAMGADLVVPPDLDPGRDLDGFAAAVRACDLVLTISNNTAHFGGALGVPTWVLLSERPLWHWFEDRPDSPWYGSVSLFRRRLGGEWAEVIGEVVTRLETAPPSAGIG